MKKYKELVEGFQSNWNDFQAKASKHPKFARFDTAANTGHKALGGAKTTIYALDHQSEPIGVFSHAFDKGSFFDLDKGTPKQKVQLRRVK